MVDRTIDEVLAAVQAANAGADSVIASRAALKQQVIDLLAAQGQLNPAVQAGLNTIFDTSTAQAQKEADAISSDAAPSPAV